MDERNKAECKLRVEEEYMRNSPEIWRNMRTNTNTNTRSGAELLF